MIQIHCPCVLLMFMSLTPLISASLLKEGKTETNNHGDVVVKSSSAKLKGQLPHGYSPLASDTTHLLDPHLLHPLIIGNHSSFYKSCCSSQQL
jgi:hypothetical protein